MVSYEGIYSGGGYGFDTAYNISENMNYGETFLNMDYRVPAGDIGFAIDPRTANQIKMVSNKISTGAKVLEVQGTIGQILESIPKQHFKEIERLKKLTGVELTFHGPLVEATGLNPQSGRWKESNRILAEKQMINAVERGHDLNPNGNVIITFHSSNGLPAPEEWIIDENGNKVLKDFYVVDEHSGNFANIAPQINHLMKEKKVENPEQLLEKQNKDIWFNSLESIGFLVMRGSNVLNDLKEHIGENVDNIFDYYAIANTPEGQEMKKFLIKRGLKEEVLDRIINNITYSDLELRQAYQQFKDIYNRSYEAVKKEGSEEDLKLLSSYRDEFVKNFKKFEDPSNILFLSKELNRGIQVLRSLKKTPSIYKPLKVWAIEKASESFANTAWNSYSRFKDNSPIISIENPPAGSGLSTGEDLRELIKTTRKRFIEKAMQEGLSEREAKDKAEKLIGITWDVGHINLLRGKGYGEKELLEETKKVGKMIKHVHLSDNFGLEHTELPMGMGNVPTKKMIELIRGYNKKIKMIAETGNWFEPFKITPTRQIFEAFGSPLYTVGEGPYWNQIGSTMGGYFSGIGPINPPVHHSIYGAGYSNLPVELGGQMSGQSRVSGTPMS